MAEKLLILQILCKYMPVIFQGASLRIHYIKNNENKKAAVLKNYPYFRLCTNVLYND